MCLYLKLYLHLELWRNLSYAKINLAFGAGHIIKEPIYFMLLTASFLHTHTAPDKLTAFRFWLSLTLWSQRFATQSFRHAAKMGEHTASKNTFIVITKLVYLLSFNILNFTWTSTSAHTSRHTHSASGQTHTSLLCNF